MKNKSPGKRVKKSHLRRKTTKKMVTSNLRMKISQPMRARKKSPMMRKTKKIKKTVQLRMSSRQRKARKNITTRKKTMKTSPLKAKRNAILVRRVKNNLSKVKRNAVLVRRVKNNLPKVKKNAVLVRRVKNNLPKVKKNAVLVRRVKNNLPKVKRKNPARETTVKSSHPKTKTLRERKRKLAIGTKTVKRSKLKKVKKTVHKRKIPTNSQLRVKKSTAIRINLRMVRRRPLKVRRNNARVKRAKNNLPRE